MGEWRIEAMVRFERSSGVPLNAEVSIIPKRKQSGNSMCRLETRREFLKTIISTSTGVLLTEKAYGADSEKTNFMKKVIPQLRKPISHCMTMNGHVVCSISRIPTVIPFGDWDYFYLNDVLVWQPNEGQNFDQVTVPKGFVTDLASIPQPLWSILPPMGRYAYAAIVHDYLYWFQPVERKAADDILATAMSDSGVSTATREAIYRGVRIGGQGSWDQNKQARERGEKRILKKFPDDRLISWSAWKNDPDVFADPQ